MDHLVDISLILTYSVLAFFFAFLLCPPFIQFLRDHKIGKNIREDASGGGKAVLFAELHAKKQGTPTMGGAVVVGIILFMILGSRILSYLGWIDHSLLNRKETYIPIFTLVSCAILGGLDDWLNLKGLWKKGIPVKPKFLFLLILSLVGAWWFYSKLGFSGIFIPFVGELSLGYWYPAFFVLVFIASGHAVNITDGLDGLAAGLLIMAYSVFGVIAFHEGMFLLATFCGVTVGALTAFLWYNINPAQFFMGDLGSLSLGATLGVIALLTNSIFPLLLISTVFILETLSVIIQLTSKRFRNGKKVFHIAPLHHHFEKVGWPETMVVMRFWIIGAIGCVFGLILAFVG
ncbi:MAG: phospho-N-acetylmuramoyl-pentapeptide-transferase [Candidatus Gracilibacteria bacterium]|nr:phospho-N-acetylmuramoyl-pentapeptide-transferase [bacterium]MDZ4217349.1 phospho-N-acetylmuramoyl-pentapeptide-transferase [Candidatus Gracilibacteria bacterium]